jgi:tetratricopeptide (TPR) repeat protein
MAGQCARLAAWCFGALLWAAPGFAQDHFDHAVLAPPTAAVPMPEGHDHAAMGHDDAVAPAVPTLLPGYGVGGFAVTTKAPAAQAFFANGMELGAAFAHKAAVGAMNEAVRLDPACAMCLWGEALVDGPTINYGKDEKERRPLAALVARAGALAARQGTLRERALIAALAQRYRPGAPARRDRAYADAMTAVQRQWPLDNEIAVLTADAQMVAVLAESDDAIDDRVSAKLAPTMALLEAVLARAPDHTPAIHFYIHASEIVGKPALAEPYADRLEGLVPRASHLVHMPSHTFYWVGRYQDAADANRRAVAIGQENAVRLGMTGPEGVWGLPYHAHNVIFGLGGAIMAGDSRTALDLARPLVARVQARGDLDPVGQLLAAMGYFALARFDPASVLAAPEPKQPYLKAAWHYARGEALGWEGDLAGLKAERAAIPAHGVELKAGAVVDRDHRAPEQMLGIMRAVLDGRLAMGEKRWADAAAAFREGAGIEETRDFSQFSDPPAFWYPVRRDLAEALLAGGDAAGARDEARKSLALRPHDAVAEATLARAEAKLAAH